ncbi:DnaJ like protein subfamily C member 10 [Myotis davidii]|uniref:DnaJ homolog subfamily C member 10 n=1 Tax=Myotis davidii TaxID=225400 RepID=L5M4P9_MYODS|nr:DnaJ like protein subfamily C member 10 [Myotis davidii]
MGVWLNKDDYAGDLKRVILCFLIVYMAVVADTDQDFYSLLGVSKTASSREIRQAFKKLALKLHPDKNPNNPNAHSDFLKINRAYEVLKDEDLRKKYDKYGEKGLADNQEGGQYESWNYYRYDFGIYDDDPEIITLDRREFDAAVNSGELWFVNFYSAGCSHCHDLAPTWRDFAKEVDGLLRIGAVNCGDDRMLCRMKGVNSYPSLFIFRSGMDGLVNVGWMDCATQANLCTSLDITTSSTAYFPPGATLNNKEKSNVLIGKFDCSSAPNICSNLYVFQPCLAVFKGQGTKEYEIHHGKKILYDILAFAKESVHSHVTTLGPQNFPANDKEPWLVDFFAPWCPPCRALLPELRKASKHLYGQLKFGTLDCTVHEGLCNMYNIQAYPTTVVFNQSNVHEYEGHHSAEQILEFIETLTGLINVGSIDCQQYHSFCAEENVRRYPEIRFFPPKSNKAYQYQFLPQASIDLTPQAFNEKVLQGKNHWVIDFYAPWCGPCQNFAPEFELLARSGCVGTMDRLASP